MSLTNLSLAFEQLASEQSVSGLITSSDSPLSPAQSLPAELWTLIFEHMSRSRDFHNTLIACLQTCKAWNTIGIKTFYRNIVINGEEGYLAGLFDGQMSVPLRDEVKKAVKMITYNDINRWYGSFTEYDMYNMEDANTGSLRDLVASHQAFQNFRARLTNLQSISFRLEFAIFAYGQIFANFPASLRSLDIQGSCSPGEVRGAHNRRRCRCHFLARLMPQLIEFRLASTEVCQRIIPQKPCPNLKRFAIRMIDIDLQRFSEWMGRDLAVKLHAQLMEGNFPKIRHMDVISNQFQPEVDQQPEPYHHDYNNYHAFIIRDVRKGSTIALPMLAEYRLDTEVELCEDPIEDHKFSIRIPRDLTLNLPNEWISGSPSDEYVDLTTTVGTDMIEIVERRMWFMKNWPPCRLPKSLRHVIISREIRLGERVPNLLPRSMYDGPPGEALDEKLELFEIEAEDDSFAPLLLPAVLDGFPKIENVSTARYVNERQRVWSW